MAGDWLKIEASTPDKPEVIGIADMLGIHPAHAFGALFLVWRWFDQHTTDGNARCVTKVTIDRLSGVTGFADAMLKVGWLSVHEEGVTLPHFDRHNGETAKKRGLTAKRVAVHKAKSNAEGNASGVSSALPREEKRREDVKTTPIGVVAELVVDTSTPTDKNPVLTNTSEAGETETQAACRETWAGYSAAYSNRYGAEPVRNAKVNAQVRQFVGRVGRTEAPGIAAFYVTHSAAFYVKKMHAFGLLLADAEKLRTEWATNRRVTDTEARQSDKTQATGNVFAELIEEARKRSATA